MAKLEQQITTTTIGGFSATITHIFKNQSTDQLEGYVTLEGKGDEKVSWNFNGTCRDRSQSLNLNMNNSELHSLKELEK